MSGIDVPYLSNRVAQSWAALAQDHPLIGHAVIYHRNTRQGPMTFRSNPSLVEMYADLPHLEGADICKAVQTGISELVIQLILEASGWRGRIASLVLPTGHLRDRFVQQRINTLLTSVPEYRQRSGGLLVSSQDTKERRKKGAENLKVKRFGDGALMFLGSNSAGDFVEFSTDIMVIDEFDQCDPDNLAKAVDRLRNSPYPQLFRIGNPSAVGEGIATIYDAGDRRLFHWVCGSCRERQPIDWFANVVRKNDDGTWEPRDTVRFQSLLYNAKAPDIRPVCRKCSRPFERDAAGAAWVAANPGKRRSYRMTRMDVLGDRLWALFTEWINAQTSKVKLKAFYNSVLGQRFQDTAAKLTDQHIEAVSVGPNNDPAGGAKYAEELVVAGIDVGAVLNVVVDVIHLDSNGKKYRRAALICAVSSFEAVQDILNRFHVQVAVIDARPETRKAQELRDWALYTQGVTTVWLCQFHPTDRVGTEDYGARIDFHSQILTVDRTQLLDATYEEIVEKRRVLPADCTSIPEFVDQMKAPGRKLDERGNRFIWDEGSDPDHYRFADAYARVAADQAQAGSGFVAG
jgi:hypothetical protein